AFSIGVSTPMRALSCPLVLASSTRVVSVCPNRNGRSPAKDRTSQTSVPDEDRRLAGTAPYNFYWYSATGYFFGHCDHFFNRIAARIGQIQCAATALFEKIVQCLNVCIRDVANRNIVAF